MNHLEFLQQRVLELRQAAGTEPCAVERVTLLRQVEIYESFVGQIERRLTSSRPD